MGIHMLLEQKQRGITVTWVRHHLQVPIPMTPQWPTVSSRDHLLNIENTAQQLVTKHLKQSVLDISNNSRWKGGRGRGGIYNWPSIRDLRKWQFFPIPRYQNVVT